MDPFVSLEIESINSSIDDMFNSHEVAVGTEISKQKKLKACVPLAPYSHSDSETEDGQPRKRKRNVAKCKKNIRKRKCVSGKLYVSSLGKEIKKRKIKPPCKHNCRLKCREKLTEVEREDVFLKFWHET